MVHHDAIRQGGDLPTWKYYYESRNMLYFHWHIMHRAGRYPRNFARLIGRAAVRQKQAKLASLWAIAKGFADGAFGRLGIRYPIVPLASATWPSHPAATEPVVRELTPECQGANSSRSHVDRGNCASTRCMVAICSGVRRCFHTSA